MSTANVGSCSNNGGEGSNSSGSGGGGGGGGPCGACKFLRRKCVPGCIFAPYFDSEQGAAHFAAVHKVFGASNVSKLLLHIPVDKRLDAVFTICIEAQARLRDPVYGCVAHIFTLQQQVASLHTEIAYLNAHIATLNLPTPPPFLPQQVLIAPQQLSISDLPSTSSAPTAYDLSVMLDPLNQHSWTAIPPQITPRSQIDSRQFLANNLARSSSVAERATNYSTHPELMSGDLQELAREYLERQAGASSDGTCNEDDHNK